MSHGFKFPLPDNVVKLIEKSQRDEIGLKTLDEKVAEAEIKSERELSNQVENLLRLKGIFFLKSRADKRTTRPKGEPDFIFSCLVKTTDKLTQRVYEMPQAQGWELKVGGRALSPEQVKMFEEMTAKPNGWTVRVIRSVQDALDELKRLGL